MSTSAGCAKNIEDDPGNPQRIVSERGIGYRFDG
jgi:hypothetical protein